MKVLTTYFPILLSLIGVSSFCTQAQFKIDLGEGRELQISQTFQIWDVLTTAIPGANDADNRNDIFIRRGRFAFDGRLRPDMSFNLIVAFDGIGKDTLTPTSGTPNAGDNRDAYIWEASWTWNVSSLANLTFGYFRPQVGKEQISSEFYVISFDKSLADNQPRIHLVGRSTGRETGLNVGGLHLGDGWSVNYNVGMFDLTNKALVGSDKKWAPLLTSRIAFTAGDPEMQKYKISYVQSYYGKRNGTTFGLNYAYEGETQVFSRNGLYGVDLLSNYGPLDLNAEYDWMYRNSFLVNGATNSTTDKVYSMKLGYIIPLPDGQLLEPTVMYAGERPDENDAVLSKNTLTGSVNQDLFDAGINWLINQDKLKINLHYVWGRKKDKAPYENFSYIGAGIQVLY